MRSSRHLATGESMEIILIPLEKSVIDYSAVAKIWGKQINVRILLYVILLRIKTSATRKT